jgi:hypothetical protein
MLSEEQKKLDWAQNSANWMAKSDFGKYLVQKREKARVLLSNCVQARKERTNIMSEKEGIFSGALRFTTDNLLLEVDHGFINLIGSGFIDLSGDGLDAVLRQAQFEEAALNHKRVSVLGHIGDRSLGGDPDDSNRVKSLIASKVVLQNDIALRAFNIFESANGGSTIDNWLRAEKELLGV